MQGKWEVMNTRAEKPQDRGKLTRPIRGPVAVRNAALRRGTVPEIVWRSRRGCRRLALSHACRITPRRTALSRRIEFFTQLANGSDRHRKRARSQRHFRKLRRICSTGAPTATLHVACSAVAPAHTKVRARDLRSNRDAALRVSYRGRHRARRGATEVAVGGASTRGSRMNQKWSSVLSMRDPGITSSQLVLLLSESVQDLKVPE